MRLARTTPALPCNVNVCDTSPGNIFLVGMMGAGKTTVGKALARRLGKPFADTDQIIIQRTGVAVPVIFEIEGEAGFRARETAVLQDLAQSPGSVIATGGGIILCEANREILNNSGTVIYLRASVEDLWRRTSRDRSRPLLQTADPQQTLRDLYVQRDPLYREVADIIVDTSSQSVLRLVNDLIRKLEAFPAPTL
jgi:shikimate kinase